MVRFKAQNVDMSEEISAASCLPILQGGAEEIRMRREHDLPPLLPEPIPVGNPPVGQNVDLEDVFHDTHEHFEEVLMDVEEDFASGLHIAPQRTSSRRLSTGTAAASSIDRFFRRRQVLMDRLIKFQISGTSEQPETATVLLRDLLDRLKELKVEKMVEELDQNPFHEGPLGMDGDSLDRWASEFRTEISIALSCQAERLAQKQSYFRSGFEKRKYPVFHGDSLEFYEFKKLWVQNVSPEAWAESIELSSLKDSVPKTAKLKLKECSSLAVAWAILTRL
jgi:hypothetical protein